jgi:5-methylcytosine-specific restriction enzyme subunit McrC
VPKVAWERWHALFGYALKLRGLVRSDSADAQLRPTSLQDLLVLQLVAEARDLIGRGLHREYVRQRAVLASPRGRIDFQRIAGRGGLREASIPCRYTRRIDDALLNRALLAGLHAASVIACDVSLRADALRLAHEMEATIDRVPLATQLLHEARGALDRRTARYAPALRLIEILHTGRAVALDDDPERSRVSIPGFALDMNSLWQRLIGRVLVEWGDAFEVREEVALTGLIAQDPAFAPRRRSVAAPRPDFALYRGGKLATYLDAKYRDLWTTSLPREMLYQLALYASAQESGAAAMLYPTEVLAAEEERLTIRDPGSGKTRASVALRPVSLVRLEELIVQPPTAARERARSAFARALCGLEA